MSVTGRNMCTIAAASGNGERPSGYAPDLASRPSKPWSARRAVSGAQIRNGAEVTECGDAVKRRTDAG